MESVNVRRTKKRQPRTFFFVEKGMIMTEGEFTGYKQVKIEKNVDFYLEIWEKSDYNTRLYVKIGGISFAGKERDVHYAERTFEKRSHHRPR